MQPVYTANQRISARDFNSLMLERRDLQENAKKSLSKKQRQNDRAFQLAIYYEYDENGNKKLVQFDIINCLAYLMEPEGIRSKLLGIEYSTEQQGWITTVDLLHKYQSSLFPTIDSIFLCVPKNYDTNKIDIITNIEANNEIAIERISLTYNIIQLYDIEIEEGSNTVLIKNDYRDIPSIVIPHTYGAFRYEIVYKKDGESYRSFVKITNCNYKDGNDVYEMPDYEERFDVSPGSTKTYYLVVDDSIGYAQGRIETTPPDPTQTPKFQPLFTIDEYGHIVKDFRGMPHFGGGGDYEMEIASVGGEYQLQLKSGDTIVSRLPLTKHSSL